MTLGSPPSGAAAQSIQLDISRFKSHIEKTLLKLTGLLHLPAGLRFCFCCIVLQCYLCWCLKTYMTRSVTYSRYLLRVR